MYKAIVGKLVNVREHPKADRLKLATISGCQVVVGLDAKEGDMGIFFPEDGRVSTDFCQANDLYPRYDEEGNRIGGGFFDPKNNRVRAQAFRGEKSYGYFANLDSVAYTGVNLDDLYEGFQFDILNDHLICEKYYTPKTLRAMQKNQGVARKTNIMFPQHVDTGKWAYEGPTSIDDGDIVYITEKLHGTSARVAFVIEEEELPARWWDRFIPKSKRTERIERTWKTLVGTRRIVLKDPITQGFYADESFRFKAAEPLHNNLHKGEVVYSELVGYVNDTTPIMASQDTTSLKDVVKKYGKQMLYTYGTLPGECKSYVYRITMVNEDGNVTELSCPQVKRRCKELGLLTVPDFAGPIVDPRFEAIDELVQSLTDGSSTLDDRHIREGVVIRVEKANGQTLYLKNKSWTFGVLEGYLKNNEDYVDLEESS